MNFDVRKLFWLLLLVSSIVQAQEMDSVATDSVEVEPPAYYLGIYLDGGGSFEPGGSGHNIFSMVGVGVQYNRWILSFTRYDFQGELISMVVFPNNFELKYRYGGANIAYQVYEGGPLDFSLGVGYYRGDMAWQNQEDGQDFLRDKFDLLKMSIKGEIGKFRYIKPYASVGYQKMRDLTLNQVSGNDFSGLFVGMGIRIGYFNQ